MPTFVSRAIQAAGLYRLAEVVYSIWAGKSLLALAIVAVAAPVIAAIANGFDWGQIDKIVLSAALIYAVLAAGWLVTIVAYRKISPTNKFVVKSYQFNCNPVPSTTPHSNPQRANNFEAVFILKNIADFPINYIVSEIEFRIGNTVGNNQFLNRGALIDAGQEAYFSSDIVTFHQPINLPVDGTLKAIVTYGRRGKEKFKRPISLQVQFSVDPAAPSGVRYSWSFAAGMRA
jgi:hypothetical protein